MPNCQMLCCQMISSLRNLASLFKNCFRLQQKRIGFSIERRTALNCNKLKTQKIILPLKGRDMWLAVWPDVGIKSSQNFPKVAPKLTITVFNLKMMLYEIAQKVINYLGTFCNKNFKKATQSGHTGRVARRVVHIH